MNSYLPVTDDVYWIGVNDRHTALFEELWPLPRGVSYNSYLIVDEKIAIVETVKALGGETFLDKIRAAMPAGRSPDYLIIDHMEPDHSGSIRLLRDVYPQMKIVGNKKTMDFLRDFYGVEDALHVVSDGDELNLGRHKLQFYLTPMVHWPETMMTYDATDRILFSGDAFGGFGALTGGIFDDEVDIEYFEGEILRYFSNIVGKYCSTVQKAIQKLSGLDLGIIAPTHGPVWREHPEEIVRLYDAWSRHEAEEGVVMVYGSMYGNTEQMMESVAKGLADEDMSRVRIHSVSCTHLSYLIRDAWRFRGLLLGAPTYDMGLFPPMEQFINILERKKLRKRMLGLFGTYGWSGGGVKTL
ncbi:MAG: FprA family A-type flavoprotein, partial [Verrucomicrobiota bacterium]